MTISSWLKRLKRANQTNMCSQRPIESESDTYESYSPIKANNEGTGHAAIFIDWDFSSKIAKQVP